MDARAPVSVAIITLNEERNLARCLGSVAWADEIVVVDSGSTDRTRDIALRHGARLLTVPWGGFAAQKNRAAAGTANLWVLSLDADEWLPVGAEVEIRAAIASRTHAAFAFRRLSAFSGGFLPRTWAPDRQIRLYRKDVAQFTGGHVHESVRVQPPQTVGRLNAPLLHLTQRSVHEQVDRLNRYSTLASRTQREGGRRFGIGRMILGPPASFLKMYVLKGGALDGVRGLIAAVDQAHYVFLKSAKLWDRTRSRDAAFEDLVPTSPEDPDPGAPYDG